jgi:hypothetical protein
MTDTDIDNVYKAQLGTSHYAALRAVFDAGFQAGAAQAVTAATQDASLTQTAPAAEVPIATV